MNKKWFSYTIGLMCLALAGIVVVQVYWMQTAFSSKSEEFSNVISDVLNSTAENVEAKERKRYYDKLAFLIDSIGDPQSQQIQNFFFIDRSLTDEEILFYSLGILKEGYDMPSTFLDDKGQLIRDTSTIYNYTSTRTKRIFKASSTLDNNETYLEPVEVLEKIGGLTKMEKAQYDDVFMEAAKTIPIHNRIEVEDLYQAIESELKNRGIDSRFEFGVESMQFPTLVRSEKFDFKSENLYKAPIFKDSEGMTDYTLALFFPDRREFLLSEIASLVTLSVVFTAIIIIVFIISIYQLITQKRISEIKSDFINNMTHEFKTPIATINLAVESIKNPIIFSDQEKLDRYLQMIRDENKRMHAQVENVLQISKLEKRQFEVEKEELSIHEIISEAIVHVELLIDHRKGLLEKKLQAKKDRIEGNAHHLTNLMVNILDNAVKYSDQELYIGIQTYNENNAIVIRIEDRGVGMTKAVSKKIFEKFYREHTGNIHNVKGHGLGLSYAKHIVDLHNGSIFVESEKGKGSVFFVKLPLT